MHKKTPPNPRQGTLLPKERRSLQRGGSAQPSPVRPFLEIAFDEVGIVAGVTANQPEAKAKAKAKTGPGHCPVIQFQAGW